MSASRPVPRKREGASSTPFSTFVKRKRQELRLAQATLAELSGLSIEFVRDVEQGRTNLRLEKVLALVDALGGVVSVTDRPFDAASLVAKEEEQ